MQNKLATNSQMLIWSQLTNNPERIGDHRFVVFNKWENSFIGGDCKNKQKQQRKIYEKMEGNLMNDSL